MIFSNDDLKPTISLNHGIFLYFYIIKVTGSFLYTDTEILAFEIIVTTFCCDIKYNTVCAFWGSLIPLHPSYKQSIEASISSPFFFEGISIFIPCTRLKC